LRLQFSGGDGGSMSEEEVLAVLGVNKEKLSRDKLETTATN
jgi:hypothetical protein